jgi:hypothetical protein
MDPSLLKSTLPESWSDLEVVADSIVADSLTFFRAGVATRAPTGEEATGSAAAFDASPLRRSCFEVLERASIVDAMRCGEPRVTRSPDGAPGPAVAHRRLFPESDEPSRWRHARSNGVALHDSWTSACDRAAWELIERDRVLRAWRGDLDPRRLPIDPKTTPLSEASSYDLVAYEFGTSEGSGWDVTTIRSSSATERGRSGRPPCVTPSTRRRS